MSHRIALVVPALLALGLVAAAPAGAATQQPVAELAPYPVIAVEAFAVEKNAATEDLPKGLAIFLQGRVIEELRKTNVFHQVLDASEPAEPAAGTAAPAAPDSMAAGAPADTTAAAGAVRPAEPAEPRVQLGCTILIFDKGSRTARYLVGFGAGQTRIKARFVLTDAQTGKEVLRFDQQGTFKGMLSSFAGNQDDAAIGAARGLVHALVNQLVEDQ
jgi:hypothetical protein